MFSWHTEAGNTKPQVRLSVCRQATEHALEAPLELGVWQTGVVPQLARMRENDRASSLTRQVALELVEQLVDAVNGHDTERLVSFYTDNATLVSPVAGEITGRAEIAKWWKTTFSLFPDWTVSLSQVLVDGERVAFFGTAAATDRNGWFGQPPTGERFEYRAIVVLTLEQGRIARDERIYDLSGLLERFEKARLDRELTVAAEVQRALLSRAIRSSGYCELIGDSLPCRAIGGDFFESVEMPSGDIAIALGDVAGKGPGAAILAALIQGMAVVHFQNENRPASTLAKLNRLLAARHLEPRFATLACGVLSPNGRFVFSSAGHNPPIVLSRDGIHRLEGGGPVLGVFRASNYEEETITLRDGDTIVVFSDGVVEARDTQDREFGENRLLSCVTACRGKSLPDMLKSILSSIQEFCQEAPQADDITILLARAHPWQS
jgi:sigma-B regulation protein RsbU (phosphoserine phosphatase)